MFGLKNTLGVTYPYNLIKGFQGLSEDEGVAPLPRQRRWRAVVRGRSLERVGVRWAALGVPGDPEAAGWDRPGRRGFVKLPSPSLVQPAISTSAEGNRKAALKAQKPPPVLGV